MRRLLFFALLIFAISSSAQINFEKGYYLDNDDQKIECFIKSVDWKNSPT